MDGNRSENWIRILNTVQTPLGFFTLLALIINGVLIALSASTAAVSIWVPISVLVLLILCVFVIAMVKPTALNPPLSLKVKVRFPANLSPFEVDFDHNNCRLEIRDLEGRIKLIRPPNLLMGEDIWFFKLPINISPDDSVRLELVEINGRKWVILPFDPHETLVDARPKH